MAAQERLGFGRMEDMMLDYVNEYPGAVDSLSERNRPSGRTRGSGAASTERDGKFIFVSGRASSADPATDRQRDGMAVCLCEDLPV